ncbi:hypothetical protein, partial [Salmonella enterica]|uniref:hypothetical protein n=1 Tax=Salmonella enterica TaxID=28901 RepID=UPI003D2C88F4
MASIAAMLLVMFVGARSIRSIAALVITVVAGLLLTSAFGLVVFQRFTLISVAFLPLFVGLGVDFAIQFVMRFR